jgi:hypothetical protein
MTRNVPGHRAPAVGRESEWAAAAAALLIVGLAAWVRFREAAQTRLWFDEIYTLWVARLPPGALLRTVGADVHPPLHFLLVSAWRALGGEGDLWIRSLSVLVGVATVAALIPFGRALFGAPAALLAAALLAVHRTHVFFSTESRGYALLWLWLVLAAWLAWRWLASGKRRDAILYVGCAAGALHTHYLAGIVLAFLGLWGLVDLRREPHRMLRWIALHGAVALLFAPQSLTLLVQARRNATEHWTRPPDLDALANLIRQTAFGMRLLVPLVAILTAAPLLLARQRRAASLLWTLTLPPVVACWWLSRHGFHLFTERYMFFVLPFLCLLLGAAIAAARPRLTRGHSPHWIAAILAALVLGLAMRSLALSRPLDEALEQERALELLRARATPDETILAADTHSLLYLRQHWPAHERTLLLWPAPRIPYYDAALVIPDAWRVGTAALDSLRQSDAIWWAMHTHNSGTDVSRTVAAIEAGAGAPELALGLVHVWRAGSDTRAAANDSLAPAMPPGALSLPSASRTRR